MGYCSYETTGMVLYLGVKLHPFNPFMRKNMAKQF
jgi:hypothetical protein